MGKLERREENIERKKRAADFEEENVLIRQPKDKEKLINNSEIQIRRRGRYWENEFKDFIIGRAKSQQEVDPQIDRSGCEFRKNESSEESYGLAREEYRDSGDGVIAIVATFRVWPK